VHDLVASFYGGYEQVGLQRRRRIHISRTALWVAGFAVVLLVVIGAGVVIH
jgi:hypothetical protein